MCASAAFVPALGSRSSVFVGQAPSKGACSLQTTARRHARVSRVSMKVYNVEIEFHGDHHMIPIDEDQTLLEGIEAHGLEVPYSCRAGVCMTCAAKVLNGEVDLGNIAMMDDLKDAGYILACSAKPRGEGIKLLMEQFDEVYDRQYGNFEAV